MALKSLYKHDYTCSNSNTDLGTILKIVASAIILAIALGTFIAFFIYICTFDLKIVLEALKDYFMFVGVLSIIGLFILGVGKLIQFIWSL